MKDGVQTKQIFIDRIRKELSAARKAMGAGNDGMVRVCARRAAGHAITSYLNAHPDARWPADAVRQLERLRNDRSFPPAIREAALRLTTKISDGFRYPFSEDPVEDAILIAGHFMQDPESAQ